MHASMSSQNASKRSIGTCEIQKPKKTTSQRRSGRHGKVRDEAHPGLVADSWPCEFEHHSAGAHPDAIGRLIRA